MSQDSGDGTYEGSRSDDAPDDTMAVGEVATSGPGGEPEQDDVPVEPTGAS